MRRRRRISLDVIILHDLDAEPDRKAAAREDAFDSLPPEVKAALDYCTCDFNAIKVMRYWQMNGTAKTLRKIAGSERHETRRRA